MKRFYSLVTDADGSVTIAMVILILVFVGLLAFVIDMAHVQTVKNELQNAADAAALAGARALIPMNQTGPPPWPMPTPPNCSEARQAAMDTSVLNNIDTGPKEKSISLLSSEVLTGIWDFIPNGTSAGTFTQTDDTDPKTNAVQVTARMRADLSQGSVVMTFAKIFGVSTVNPHAIAVAAIGYYDTLPEGSRGDGFIGISQDFIQRIADANPDASPTNPSPPYYLILNSAGGSQGTYENADTAGWVGPPVGTSPGTDYLKAIIDGTGGTSFDMSAGVTQASLGNGANASVVMAIKDQIQKNNGSWPIILPSFYSDSWTPEPETIQGLWDVTITGAWKPGDKLPSYVLDALRPYADQNDQLFNSVSIIEFRYEGPVAVPGTGGGNIPSNIYAQIKLVQ